jgi:hypothetical protein
MRVRCNYVCFLVETILTTLIDYFENKKTVYKKLSKEEKQKLEYTIEQISIKKRNALDANITAAESEKILVNADLFEMYSFLHRYKISVSDILPKGL